MSEREIEALRRRWRQELASEDSKTFKGAAPPLDEQTEPKPSLDVKQLLRLRSPMDIARPKKLSFDDMPGQSWPPKIDPRKPIVFRGSGVAAQKKRRESRHDKS